MGRPAKVNPVPTTSITIPVSLALELKKSKPRNRILGDFINILLGSYQSEKETIRDLQDAVANYKITNDVQANQMKIKDKLIDELKQVNEALKKDKVELERRLIIN